ncbi:MAG: XRE family transcriptional regulator [Hymenobacter sp.]|nr:MAG: XRE family transcriptional regulator [Hymenobacter sp.]
MKQSLKLRILRHHAGMDQHEVARALKISTSDYSRIECSLEEADSAVLEKLLSLFGLDAKEFASRAPAQWATLSRALLEV